MYPNVTREEFLHTEFFPCPETYFFKLLSSSRGVERWLVGYANLVLGPFNYGVKQIG